MSVRFHVFNWDPEKVVPLYVSAAGFVVDPDVKVVHWDVPELFVVNALFDTFVGNGFETLSVCVNESHKSELAKITESRIL